MQSLTAQKQKEPGCSFGHLKLTLNWPCCTVASAVSQSSSLFCRWEKTPQNEHRACCRIASGSSPRTWRATHGRVRGGWNASAQHAPTGSPWSWGLTCCCKVLAAWRRPVSAATRTNATWCHLAWSGVYPLARDPGPARTATARCCRCCPAAQCCSWEYCSSFHHTEAYMAPDGLACFEAASGMMRHWEEKEKWPNKINNHHRNFIASPVKQASSRL